ncbi:MAG TPA: fibronectin type III domain-containing protein, partial [Candidatus Woesebacteria bacterium]|nr:fibronectin type III domain-containing protein [Candidatus Woesebacteria bacterium]
MKTATILKKNLTKKQKIIIGVVIAIPIIVGIIYGLFLLMQQTALTSRANEETPTNVVVEPGEDNTVKVQWNTGVDTSAILEYGTEANAASMNKVAISETATTNHSVDISSLEPGTYYFQIRVGETIYDNDGLFWSFTVGNPSAATTPEPSIISPSPEEEISVVPTPTQEEASPAATITQSPLDEDFITPSVSPVDSVCLSSNCSEIQKNLGSLCTTQDYLKCILTKGSLTEATPTNTTTNGAEIATPTGNNAPTPTNDPSSTAVSGGLKRFCKPTYLQANSCSSWNWSSMADIDKQCADTFTKYFVQCKSTSFTSSATSGTWYCNKTVTSADITLPCDNAPT